jgi:hypothetical protein
MAQLDSELARRFYYVNPVDTPSSLALLEANKLVLAQ